MNQRRNRVDGNESKRERRFMKTTTTAATILAGLFVASAASAHHAFDAEYDLRKPLTLVGKVTKVTLVNPHGWIYLDSKNAQGKVVNWALELPGVPTLLNQGGVDRNVFSGMIEGGEEVTVAAYGAKDGSPRAWAESLTRSDRRTVITLGGNPGQAEQQAVVPRNRTTQFGVIVGQSLPTLNRLPVGDTLNLGAWWRNAALVEQLGLTEDQKLRIERAYENHPTKIVSSTEQLEKDEAQLAKLLEADSIDRNAVLTQIDRVILARGEMERANSAMTLEMRETMSRAQWIQLPKMMTGMYAIRVGGRGGGQHPTTQPSPPPPGQGGRRGGRGLAPQQQ